jgi:hypothetical protein
MTSPGAMPAPINGKFQKIIRHARAVVARPGVAVGGTLTSTLAWTCCGLVVVLDSGDGPSGLAFTRFWLTGLLAARVFGFVPEWLGELVDG